MYPSLDLPTSNLPPPPLVGRDAELDLLSACYAECLAGGGTLVLVSGEAGIGKSALIQSFARQTLRDNALVLYGCCYDLSTTPPYGLWLEVTDRYRPHGELPHLPEVLKRGTGVGDLSSQWALFEVARSFFTSIAENRPLVLMLEDLHWADQASLDLLRYLARTLDSHRVLVIATYRHDEITRNHPLYPLLPTLIREAQATRIELDLLSRADVKALVRERWSLPTPDETRLVNYLLAHAEGHPLFTMEVLRTLEQSGFFRETQDGWVMGDLAHVPVPRLVQQVIEGRIARLDGETRRLLRVAAVIGQEVPLDLWQEIGEVSGDALLDVVEESVDAHVLQESHDGRSVRFGHALTREVLYESSLTSRRQERGWLLYRAGRLRRFTDPERALALLSESASIASSLDDPVLSAFAQFDLGHLHILVGDLRRGIEAMLLAAPALDALPSDRRQHSMPIARWVADSLPSDTDPLIEDDGSEARATAFNVRLGVLIFWLALAGRTAEAMELGEPYIAQTTEIDGPSAAMRGSIGDACCGLGMAYALLGRAEGARRCFARATANHRSTAHYRMITADAWHELSSVQLPFHADEVEARWRLIRQVEAAWQLSEHLGAWSSVDTELQAGRIPILLLEGEWGEVRRRGRAAQGQERRTGRLRSYQSAFNLTVLGTLARQQGETAEAWIQVRKLLPAGPEAQPGECYYEIAVAAQRLAIALALDGGDLRTARAWLEAHDRWLEWSGAVLGRAEASLLWAQYHQRAGEYQAAGNHADQALKHAMKPRQPLALIAVHRFLGHVDTAAGNYAVAEQHLQESLSLADACAAPFERALTELELAGLRAAQGQQQEALRLLGGVRETCEQLNAAPTLRQAEQLAASLEFRHGDVGFGLTAREVEVLKLLVQGMTDKEIAGALFISHHTVMRHVSSILRKLDVDSRTAAVACALRSELV